MNKTRCRPGDLAVVISANLPTNLGRVVLVIKPDDGNSDLRYPLDQNAWIVQADKPLVWLVDGKKVRRKRGPAPDAQLQPIRGYRPPERLSHSKPERIEDPECIPEKG